MGTNSPRQRGFNRTSYVLIALILLVVVGVGSYFGLGLLGIHVPGTGGSGGSDVQTPITTTSLHESVTYAGVTITVLSAQQSQNFIDDPNTTTTGMVRLNLQEQNSTTVQVSWLYSDIARLILPDKKTISPTFVKAKVGIAPGGMQTSIVDFAVPMGDKLGQLTLQLGAANEAQMDIPLTGHADVSKYAPKNVKIGGQLLYFGLNWTLVSATIQWSIAGQQASKGMDYVIVTLAVDNTLSQEAITGSPFTYIRLQSGAVTASPVDTTLPVSFAMSETGKSGTVTFLLPQSSSACTLILLSQSQSGAKQAAMDFQLS